MSSRPAPDSEASKNRFTKAGALVRQRALTGTEASTIGFVLVLYIGAFAGLGYWLDSYFKTSWIVAVGVLVGALVGFREMFRMAQKLGRESIEGDAEKMRAQLARSTQIGIEAEPKKSAPRQAIKNEKESESDSSKPRFFSIPPPPTASFEKSDFDDAETDDDSSSRPKL